MNRRRSKNRGLTDSRIYQKYNRLYFYAPEPMVNPDTGKKTKWHNLCHVSEGEHHARVLARRIIDHNTQGCADGDMPRLLRDWMAAELQKREKDRPADPMLVKMFEKRNKDLLAINEVIARTFGEFNVNQVIPADVANFVDQWEGRRMAEVYRSHLSKFFQWACRRGYRADNPTREVTLEKPKKHDVYITHEQFYAIRDALLTGNNGKRNPSGMMMQCYVDLCYLLYQRTTDVRLLKINEITPDGIYVKPTKTDSTSGKDVLIPMTSAIEEVIARARAEQRIQSMYVICKPRTGKPYDATGLRTAWYRACARVGLKGLTLRDLRAKAATDAKLAGSTLDEIKTGLVHTSTGTTAGYIRVHDTPTSLVTMTLPPRK